MQNPFTLQYPIFFINLPTFLLINRQFIVSNTNETWTNQFEKQEEIDTCYFFYQIPKKYIEITLKIIKNIRLNHVYENIIKQCYILTVNLL